MSAQPVPAATVILVREGDPAFRVYLLQRSAESRFMPGSYVFPGGVMEAEDRDGALLCRHVDLDDGDPAARLGAGLSREDTLAYALTAVRETYEETGVLLAHPEEGGPDSGEGADIAAECSDSRPPFRALVLGGKRVLALSLLLPWAHWITPEVMKHRFDTRFFLTSLPQGQECRPDRTETVHGVWITPLEALEGNQRGEMALSPPTMATLQEMLPYNSVEELLAVARLRAWGEPRMPRAIRGSEGALLLLPWDPLYGREAPPGGVAVRETLAAGTPFSRLAFRDGFWRPVR